MAIYTSSRDAVAAIPTFGLTMDSMAVMMSAPDAIILRMYISQGAATYFADFDYSMAVSNGVHSFTYVGANPNGDVIKDAVTPLLNYFSNNQFTLSWYANPSMTIFPRVRFTPVGSPTVYFLALLLP
jgi:hypothetical protein